MIRWDSARALRTEIPVPDSLLRLGQLCEEALACRRAPPMLIDERFARFAVQRHQVGPLLHAAIETGRHDAAPGVCRLLAASYHDSAERRKASLMQLDRIASQFSARRIRWMTLKGAAQASQLYNDPVWRNSADIDVLVARDQFAAAFDALRDIGFAAAYPRMPASRLLKHSFLRAFRDVTLIAQDDPRCAIELHSRLFMPRDRRASGLQLKILDGRLPAPALGPDLAFYIIAHGALSLWVRLKWLVDLVPLFNKLSAGEKLETREYARRSGAENSFAASLLLLRKIFRSVSLAPLDSWLDKKTQESAVRRRLLRYATSIGLEREAGRSPFDNALISLQSNWLLFEAASTRISLVVRAPGSSLARRFAEFLTMTSES